MKKVKPIAWVILCLAVLYAAIAAAAAYKQDTNLFDLMTCFKLLETFISEGLKTNLSNGAYHNMGLSSLYQGKMPFS